jgi:hypothetical protein
MGIARTIPIGQFKGLNERKILGGDPSETTSLDNVIVRNGTVKGRLGMSKFDDISVAGGTIHYLMDYYHTDSGESSLLRLDSTAVEVWDATNSEWDDITGATSLTLSNFFDRPQHAMIGELNMLIFTNEGQDRPRKWVGTGNTALLGGTPPFCKAIGYYVGFGALGNISSDGVTWRPLDLILSDDPDNTWEDCSGSGLYVTTLTLDESPGEIRCMGVIGKSLFVYKSDAIVEVKFTGGPTRFARNKMAFPLGILAPLSRQPIGEMGEIFLATDRNLYINNGQSVVPLPRNVQKSLQETLTAFTAPYCRSMVDLSTETYILGYQREGSAALDATLSYNYRTGEFSRSQYPVEFTAMLGFKWDNDVDVYRLASSQTLVYQLEEGADDDGDTSKLRYFDIDWSQFGYSGNKYMLGAQFVFKKSRDCRVRISMGVDKNSKLLYPKTFSLQGRDVNETEVRVDYRIPSPLMGSWFRFRVEMYQDSTSQCELLGCEPEMIPLSRTSDDNARYPQAAKLNA